MIGHSTARKIFSELRLHSLTGSEAHRRTTVVVEAGRVRAFRNESEHIGLVVPITEAEYESFHPDTRSTALRLTKVRIDGSPNVRLSLTDPKQDRVFSVFVDEVLDELSQSPPRPSATLTQLIQRWRRLFSGSNNTHLSASEELGLLCELELLLHFARNDPSVGIDRWTGPDGYPHDFELPGTSIECKASETTNGLRITIHGLTQLSPTPGKELRLVVRRYRPDPDGALSVPGLVDALIEVPGIQTDVLLEKLQASGFPLSPEAGDSFRRFNFIDSYEFDVSEDFPQVRPTGPEHRVQDVAFSVDLSGPESVPGFVRSGKIFEKEV